MDRANLAVELLRLELQVERRALDPLHGLVVDAEDLLNVLLRLFSAVHGPIVGVGNLVIGECAQ